MDFISQISKSIKFKIILIQIMILTMNFPLSAAWVDNGNGTITDSGTKLVWQKCSQGLSGTGCTGIPIASNWLTAVSYCTSLNLASKVWRLPNRNELQSLVFYAPASPVPPAIDTTFFPNTQIGNYWTSSTYSFDTNHAWQVSYFDGKINYDNKSNTYYVRCVAGP